MKLTAFIKIRYTDELRHTQKNPKKPPNKPPHNVLNNQWEGEIINQVENELTFYGPR